MYGYFIRRSAGTSGGTFLAVGENSHAASASGGSCSRVEYLVIAVYRHTHFDVTRARGRERAATFGASLRPSASCRSRGRGYKGWACPSRRGALKMLSGWMRKPRSPRALQPGPAAPFPFLQCTKLTRVADTTLDANNTAGNRVFVALRKARHPGV